jgi:hypothetical protein
MHDWIAWDRLEYAKQLIVEDQLTLDQLARVGIDACQRAPACHWSRDSRAAAPGAQLWPSRR